jgi:hypothetical protein
MLRCSRKGARRGQIIIPALLLFPTMFLFVYLLFETAKLSREKIRHQFAMDSAAFVEMTNYSDFLNRTAYVNGAFPMRIYEEGYGDQQGHNLFAAECSGPPDKHDPCPPTGEYPPYASYSDVMYKTGAFPRSQSGRNTYDTQTSWDIEYEGSGHGGHRPRQTQMTEGSLEDEFELFGAQEANWFWHGWKLATELYQLYVQVYSLLGSVEDAQFRVLSRLASQHSFMSKSYWLNTGEDGGTLVASFRQKVPDFTSSSIAHPLCQRHLKYWGNTYQGGGGVQPYVPQYTDPSVDLAANNMSSPGCNNQGLFQIMWIKQSEVDKLNQAGSGAYPGLELWMTWNIPNANYFNVDFANQMGNQRPGNLHTTISLSGDPANKPSVWPDPTPKFQVRQFP